MSPADNYWKQFRPGSGPTSCRAWSGSKLFDTLLTFLKEFFEKVDFEKNQQTTKKHEKLPSMQRVKPRNRLHQRRSLPRQPLLHRIAQKLPASLLYFSPIICLTAVLGAARVDCQNFITGFYHFCRNYWSTVCIPKIHPGDVSLREIGGTM